MSSLQYLVAFCVFHFYLKTVSSFSVVPLLMWSNDRSVSLNSKDVVVGTTLTEKEVEEKFMKSVLKEASHGILLFVFDKLSIDDFTKYASTQLRHKQSVFENIKKSFSNNKGLLIPSVQTSSSRNTINFLKSQNFDRTTELFSSDIENWKKLINLKERKRDLVILHMLPAGDSNEKDRQKTFSENDNIIGEILKVFSGQDRHFTALLTSEESSERDMVLADTAGSRHLLQVNEVVSGKIYNASGCVLMHAEDIYLEYKNVSADFVNATYTVTGLCRNDNESSLDLKYSMDLPKGVTALKLSMQFLRLSQNAWKCQKMEAKYTGNLNGTKLTSVTLSFDCSSLASPNEYSYVCAKSSFPGKDSGMTLSVKRLQIQAFGITGNKFNDAYDCVGFFTMPILTGFFVALLLISILMVGVMSMMGIQTMDRFDDPKGPTIQVPHE